MTTESNAVPESLYQSLPPISIVTESDAKQGKQHHKRKLPLRFTVIIGFYSWVGWSNWLHMFLFVWLKEMFCVLMCHSRITVDSSWSRLVSRLREPQWCLSLIIFYLWKLGGHVFFVLLFWLCRFPLSKSQPQCLNFTKSNISLNTAHCRADLDTIFKTCYLFLSTRESVKNSFYVTI